MSRCGIARGGRGFTCSVSVHVVTVQDGFCYFSLESVIIPTKPHQPLSFNFPRGHLGRKERSCQPSWFAKWPFCSYIMMNQKMLFLSYLFDGVEA